MMLRYLLGLASPAGSHGRLSVLIFHRVLERPDPLFPGEVDARQFQLICQWLTSLFNVLPLPEAVARWRDGTLPERALAITFDDGYEDNCSVAMPILVQHGLSATFFVATGFLDGGRMWNDTLIEAVRRTPATSWDLSSVLSDGPASVSLASSAERRAAIEQLIRRIKYLPVEEREEAVHAVARLSGTRLPTDLMMTSAQVTKMHRKGMTIGAHTVSHCILAGLSADDIRDEMTRSRDALQSLIGDRVGLFAYPNGKPGQDYDARSAGVAQELGFDAAFTTAWGAAGSTSDRFQLPRFTPWDRTRLRFGWRMMTNLRQAAPQVAK
ncbi:MAG: carbohydrate esterase family protein [Leptothrix sp. (in: Bacteria)]|nr:carbohydrate esterase family protein [Leptothrix sp. (in: b-proteobacteria)]